MKKDMFNPATAKLGDAFKKNDSYSSNVLYYVGMAPIERDGSRVYAFQRRDGVLGSVKESKALSVLETIPGRNLFIIEHSGSQNQPQEQTQSKGKRTMDKNIAALLRNDTVTVTVTFDGTRTVKETTPSGLTYVTHLKLAVGDNVIVQNANGTFMLGRVMQVDEDLLIAPNSDTEYMWVVMKVDLKAHAENMEKNRLIKDTMAAGHRAHMRRGFAQSIMSVLPTEQQQLLSGVLGEAHPPTSQIGE